jgi:hypothetical protein
VEQIVTGVLDLLPHDIVRPPSPDTFAQPARCHAKAMALSWALMR